MSKIQKSKDFEQILAQVKAILNNAQKNSYKAINFFMVKAYWEIGRIIVQKEQQGKHRANYGGQVIKQLSEKLSHEFGHSMSERNLWHIRNFFVRFPKLNALRSELSWTHYRLLLTISDTKKRRFFLFETINNKWSTRELERQIHSLLYERISLTNNKKSKKRFYKIEQVVAHAKDIIKDPYVLEFLHLQESKKYLESDLEDKLIEKMQSFLLELGKGFTFVARQKRVTVDGDHYYIDLIFYNYNLRCFVLIDLKVGKLTHQDIGQMDFYVRYFEKEEKSKNDNPTIGLILCTCKNETMIKYTLLNKNRQIFASEYKLYLPTKAELKKEIESQKLISD